ncbi:hypothetical protein HDA31_005437 [Micromonospora carbonacea subsp. aurantiaca]|nr:hypothetical protein [Micromonospora carbonacea]
MRRVMRNEHEGIGKPEPVEIVACLYDYGDR